jgi:hypothetical protein
MTASSRVVVLAAAVCMTGVLTKLDIMDRGANALPALRNLVVSAYLYADISCCCVRCCISAGVLTKLDIMDRGTNALPALRKLVRT